MSTNEKATKLDEKEGSVNFVKNEASSAKPGTIASETCIRPRFASHTLSSLMKTRTPLKKSSSRSAKASKRSQVVISSKLNRIYKRRSITKQSKSMQALMTIVKRRNEKKDHRASASRQDKLFESTTAICECAENSLVCLPNELIKDISRDLKKCAASPAKSVAFSDEPAKVELQMNEEKEVTNLENREVEFHRGSREPGEETLAEDCSAIEAQIRRQNVNDQKFRRGNRKTWTIRKSETRLIDNSQDKDDRSVVNCAASTRKRSAFQKNLVFTNQRVWRPPGVTRSSIIKSTISLTQSMSQKSSRPTERAIASTENKFSSIEHVEMLNNEPTNTISVNQSKIPMKENRDPRANRVTKICEHLAETKQRQRLQNGGAIPKRRRSTTKVGSKTSNKHNNAKPTRSRSRSKSNSRHQQIVTSRESSQNRNEQHNTESAVIYRRRSRPSEVIHTLKEIINGVKEDEDVEENAVNAIEESNNVFNNKEDDSGLQANCDISAEMSQNDEINFTKDNNFDEPNQPFDQSSCKSISTQTEESLNSKENLKITLTQSSSNSNNIDIGCNTMNYNAICKNVEVSCDLINSTNLKADIDSTIEDKTPTLEDVPVHTESIKRPESSIEDEYNDKKLLVSESKQTLSTGTLELEDYDVMETPSNTTNDFIKLEEKIMNENSQTFSQVSTNSDDKTNIGTHQESIKYSNDSEDNSLSEKSHRPSSSMIYDYDASCSSEELAEYLENDVQHGNIVMSELKENIPNIPSDVIAALELAGERARNLHKAIIIYYENLISRETEKRDEETEAENHKTERYACFPSCEIKHRKRFESDEKYDLLEAANDEDVDRFSTCSSKSSNSVQMCESALEKISLADYREFLNQEEGAALPREKAIAKSSAHDLADVKSLMQLLLREKYALELFQEEDEYNGEDFEAAETMKTLALPMTNEKASVISRENLLPFIYCILFSVVFWYLQFSFQCKPAT